MTGNRISTVLGALLTLAAAGAYAQQSPVRILVGFAPGGSVDSLARYLAERLREPLGRTVIVENRAGAAGRLAVDATRAAVPDGSVLMIIPPGPVTLFPHIFKTLKYDPVRDFTPIARLGRQDLCLSTGPATPPAAQANLDALRAWIKVNSAKASYGSPGSGSLPHFFGVLFAQRTGLDMVHVPYKGSALTVNDLVAGQLPLMMSPCTEVLAQHRAGKARIVASSGNARSVLSPDVPTFREQGVDILQGAWFGLYGPANLPDAIVQPLMRAVLEALSSPEGRAAVVKLGIEPDPAPADELRAVQQRDFALMGEIVKLSGFTPTD